MTAAAVYLLVLLAAVMATLVIWANLRSRR